MVGDDLKDLKKKSPAELVAMAEERGVEGASTMRKQDLMFGILKAEAEEGETILGLGTIEVLPDGFGFLRSPEANYLAGPDDIYVSPNQVRKFGLRTGDTVEGEIREDDESYVLRVLSASTEPHLRSRHSLAWSCGFHSSGKPGIAVGSPLWLLNVKFSTSFMSMSMLPG